ncbi:hypothetical protein BDB01DRAFT_846045 [Pilobolus umbonatus]|nr:hypothetical protein BDB01DRAFT_846045 [Pilobolus umbonatus]
MTSKLPRVIVTGNDSADLDSIISALLFAYISQLNDKSRLYIPLIKVPKVDLELRPELKFVFEGIETDYRQLICIDDIKLTPNDTGLVLVDHNKLTAPFNTEEWERCVIGVIDHHVDEKCYLDASFRIISAVGSTASLVMDYFHVDQQPKWLNNEIIQLALAPLLVDTMNLKWELGRTTELDIKVFNALTQHQVYTTTSNTDYYNEIERVKSEVDNLSTYDILRKDYKEFADVNGYRVGTSSVAWNFEAWISRDRLDVITSTLHRYARDRDLDVVLIVTGYEHDRDHTRGGDYRRELGLFIVNKNLLPVRTEFENNQSLQLQNIVSDNKHNLFFYKQGNVKLSRKQTWPLLKGCVESLPKKQKL